MLTRSLRELASSCFWDKETGSEWKDDWCALALNRKEEVSQLRTDELMHSWLNNSPPSLHRILGIESRSSAVLGKHRAAFLAHDLTFVWRPPDSFFGRLKERTPSYLGGSMYTFMLRVFGYTFCLAGYDGLHMWLKWHGECQWHSFWPLESGIQKTQSLCLTS